MVHVQITGWQPTYVNANFELSDAYGKLIMKGELLQNTLIDLSQYAFGIYNLRLNLSETRSENYKIIHTQL